MRSRRRAREIALQILYQLDLQEGLAPRDGLRLFWAHLARGEGVALTPAGTPEEPEEIDDETRQFAERLVEGVRDHQRELDEAITAASRNWRLERMARVDRNLLRLGLYEIRYAADVPPKVALNEAIEIAKRFGTSESPAFVNGILDRCLAETKKTS